MTQSNKVTLTAKAIDFPMLALALITRARLFGETGAGGDTLKLVVLSTPALPPARSEHWLPVADVCSA